MSIATQRLTIGMVEQAPEIAAWLDQFPLSRRAIAVDLLLKLEFIKRDVYAEWLKNRLTEICNGACAVYAVRKLDGALVSYWDDQGRPPQRPANALGSEELVQSVVASLSRADGEKFIDHPAIRVLKEERIRDIVLVDDSIGSGQRVADFINLLMNNKTIMSWWSFGLIQFTIIALIRTKEAEERIIRSVRGSDHTRRVYRKSEKIHFVGHHQYHAEDWHDRWGENAVQIQNLCDSISAIPYPVQRGFGAVMSNKIFYHSVPDNIPGLLWSTENGWMPLFPNRSFPLWLPPVLDGVQEARAVHSVTGISETLIAVLKTAKRGIRTIKGLSQAVGLDPSVLQDVILRARTAGLLSEENRLTRAGVEAIWEERANEQTQPFDRSLYIPKQWCVGRGTVQPSGPIEVTRRVQAESTGSLLNVDGDAGQASLERTDARSATPPLSVVTQIPSESRMGDDAHGPKGEMEW